MYVFLVWDCATVAAPKGNGPALYAEALATFVSDEMPAKESIPAVTSIRECSHRIAVAVVKGGCMDGLATRLSLISRSRRFCGSENVIRNTCQSSLAINYRKNCGKSIMHRTDFSNEKLRLNKRIKFAIMVQRSVGVSNLSNLAVIASY
jgi:hypothetical protein